MKSACIMIHKLVKIYSSQQSTEEKRAFLWLIPTSIPYFPFNIFLFLLGSAQMEVRLCKFLGGGADTDRRHIH